MRQGTRGDAGNGAVIIGATLVDPTNPEPVEDSAVVIDSDGRISEVGRAGSVRCPAGATRTDAAGLTLLPGLVDCHAHIAMLTSWRDGLEWPTPSGMIVEQLKAGQRWVGHGVTTVRDAWGATAGLRLAFASESFPGPRLQISTGPVRSSAVSLHNSPTGVLFPSSPELPMDPADGVDEVRRAARLRVAAGADWIKVRAGGWTFDPERDPPTTEYGVDELRAVVEEAAAARIRGVMAHTQGPDSIRNALEAGIRSIEHGDLIDEETIALMKQLDAVLCVQGPKSRPAGGEAARYWDQHAQCIAAAVEAGVRLVLGSDALGDEYPHAVIAHLSRCGLGAWGALRAATLEGARLLGLDHETGSIEVGKSADLMLLDGDPVGDPDVWHEPDRVVLSMLRGRVMADRR